MSNGVGFLGEPMYSIEDGELRSWMARVHIGRLRMGRSFLRAVSGKHRVLYIGAMPEV